jgi:hypothetical protein
MTVPKLKTAAAAATGALVLAVMLTLGAAPAFAANTDNTLTVNNFSVQAQMSTGTIVVANWTDNDGSCPTQEGDIPDTLTATIDWGDGTPVELQTLSPDNNCGIITGSHTYALKGSYTVTVTFDDFDNDTNTDEGVISSTGTATVLPLPVPTSKAQCMHGGWQHVADNNGDPFKTQGDCISFVATGGKNPAKVS